MFSVSACLNKIAAMTQAEQDFETCSSIAQAGTGDQRE